MGKVAYPNCYFSFYAPREANILLPSSIITLGDHIRKVRIERGQYQSEIAKMFRVTTDTVTNWELNRSKIERIYLPVIEEYLGYLPEGYELTILARKLIQYRWERKISIKQIAREIGVDYSCITNAEKGKLNFQKKISHKINSFILM